MQVIKAPRDEILKPLQAVANIVEKRTTMPVLANVLVSKNGRDLSFTGTDIDMQIETTVPIGTEEGSQQLTVSARKLVDILRTLPPGEVTVSTAGAKVEVRSGKSRFALQTLPAQDFPKITTGDEARSTITLAQKTLRHLLQMVHFAMAVQDIRFYLNGLLLVLDTDGVRAVATDGHRLAFCSSHEAGASAKAEVIVPRKAVTELMRQLADSDEEVTLQCVNHQLKVAMNGVEIITKLVEGKFPDYQRVIPTGYQKLIAVNRDEFMACLQRASILTNEKFRGVRLTLGDNVLKIQSNNAEQEEAVEELDVDYQGEPLEIGFNVNYLLDVLGNLKADVVKIEFGSGDSSALISLPGEDSFRYVLMPMRI